MKQKRENVQKPDKVWNRSGGDKCFDKILHWKMMDIQLCVSEDESAVRNVRHQQNSKQSHVRERAELTHVIKAFKVKGKELRKETWVMHCFEQSVMTAHNAQSVKVSASVQRWRLGTLSSWVLNAQIRDNKAYECDQQTVKASDLTDINNDQGCVMKTLSKDLMRITLSFMSDEREELGAGLTERD